MSKRHQFIASGKKTRKGQQAKDRHRTTNELKSLTGTSRKVGQQPRTCPVCGNKKPINKETCKKCAI